MTTFNVGDRVRVTPEYAAWYKRNFYDTGFINGDTNLIVTAIQSDGGILVATEDRNVVVRISDAKYLIPKPDTAQAVIEAARALMRHVRTEIIVERETGKTYLYLKTDDYDCDFSIAFEESEDDLPDTIPGCLAVLSGALEAHDEATIESEDE